MKRNQQASSHLRRLSHVALAALPVLYIWLAILAWGCEDRLPGDLVPTAPADSSDNMFVLDGDGYSQSVFRFSRHSARAYFFSDDTLSSILNAEVITGPTGKQVQVVVHINIPGMASGVYEWKNGIIDAEAKSKVRIAIDTVEYVSVVGSTQVFFVLDPSSRRLFGAYAGILESAAGKQVRVTRGHFDGGFF